MFKWEAQDNKKFVYTLLRNKGHTYVVCPTQTLVSYIKILIINAYFKVTTISMFEDTSFTTLAPVSSTINLTLWYSFASKLASTIWYCWHGNSSSLK